MAATANDLISKGFDYEVVSIRGLDVEIKGMTVEQAVKFSEKAKKSEDNILLMAYLLKLCCPAFKSVWWTPQKIRKKLALNVMLEVADKIMVLSGYKAESLDTAVKL